MVVQLKKLEDAVYLARSFNVKVIVNYSDDPDSELKRFIDNDELHVRIEQNNPESEWQALLMISTILDIWARFKSVYVDHEERVVYVDV
jgi:hypothetical protein